MPALSARNELGSATSPYLLQHAHQPVHWRQWSPSAFAEARARGCPVLLSIGYAACHWCHVMAHESFDDPHIAAVMNRDFVCIKLDREERPDLDHLYMASLQAMGEQGGWPLTMFLDASGAAFWGGTYFPPEARWGRPGFVDVLEAIARAYGDADASVSGNAARISEAVRRVSTAQPGRVPDLATLQHACERLNALVDRDQGGIRSSQKFPNFPLFRLLAQRGARGDAPAAEACLQLAQALCRGGIQDHVGGGLFRYATDRVWLVPHFEKMLYDNGQFLDCLALAHAARPQPLLADTAARCVAFLQRELAVDGAFAASLDADSPGGEGAYYVWTEAQIDEVLHAAAARFKTAFGVQSDGNWEGVNILHRVGAEDEPFAAERAALLRTRADRSSPARDDKILADWNGLAIQGLCRAAAVFERPDWIDLARAAFTAVRTMLSCDDRLNHAWRGGRIGAAGLLDDLAAMTLAALALHAATGEPGFLEQAMAWAEEAETWHGPAQTGYFLTASDALDLPEGLAVRPHSATDGPTPAGSGMMAEALARLHHVTGAAVYAQRARAAIEAFAGDTSPTQATLLAASELLQDPVVVVIVGETALPQAAALARIALASPDPATCVLRRRSGADLDTTHPAHGMTAPAGNALAFLCRGNTCLPPIADPATLAAALREPAARR